MTHDSAQMTWRCPRRERRRSAGEWPRWWVRPATLASTSAALGWAVCSGEGEYSVPGRVTVNRSQSLSGSKFSCDPRAAGRAAVAKPDSGVGLLCCLSAVSGWMFAGVTLDVLNRMIKSWLQYTFRTCGCYLLTMDLWQVCCANKAGDKSSATLFMPGEHLGELILSQPSRIDH